MSVGSLFLNHTASSRTMEDHVPLVGNFQSVQGFWLVAQAHGHGQQAVNLHAVLLAHHVLVGYILGTVEQVISKVT